MPAPAQSEPAISVFDGEIDIEEIMLDCAPINTPFDVMLRDALTEEGFRVGRIVAHPFHDIWTVRISSTDNLARDRRSVTRRIRKALRATEVPMVRDSITISLEGRRGLVILILPTQHRT